MQSKFFAENTDFILGGVEHLSAIGFFIVLTIVSVYLGRNHLSQSGKFLLGNIMAFFISLTIVAWVAIELTLHRFDIQEDLPLYLCSLVGLLMPVFTLTRKKLIYEILLFWTLAGTIQAVVTPDLKEGLPHYTFFRYFIVHAGIIVVMLYATFVYNMRPVFKSIFKSFLAFQLYLLFVILVNFVLDANYSYLNAKPPVPSILDYFGPWPVYILVGELVVLPLFGLVYLPFHLFSDKTINNQQSF